MVLAVPPPLGDVAQISTTISNTYADLDKAKLTVESSGKFKIVAVNKSKASKAKGKKTDYGKCETVAQANQKAPDGVLYMVKTTGQAKDANFSKSKGKYIFCQTCKLYASNWKCLRAHWNNQKKN